MTPEPDHAAANTIDPRYVEARGVLLDALTALAPYKRAFIVAGAQAVHLRTGDADLAVAPYTTDGDLTLDPAFLGEDPLLEAAMMGAGFQLALNQGRPEPGTWVRSVVINGEPFAVPVDLIVPERASTGEGTRGARLGVHGKMAARRARGLEAALVDHAPMRVSSLDAGNSRSVEAEVAGAAALLVAKAHKLHERVAAGRAHRLDDKDALDVLRLMQTTAPRDVGETFRTLGDHPIAGRPSLDALDYLDALFGRRGGLGVEMAARAVRVGLPPETVEAICTAYTARLLDTARDG